MRSTLTRLAFATLAGGVFTLSQSLGADPVDDSTQYVIQTLDGALVYTTAYQDPVAPVQPIQPEQPIGTNAEFASVGPSDSGSVWGGGVSLAGLPTNTNVAASPVASVVQGQEAAYLGTTDVGDLMEVSGGTSNVMLFSRSPISNEPRIRGYRYAQIRNTVNGVPYFPIRPDLDTPLSRIDSSIIEDVVIIDGPYSVRLGPGFSFVDVRLKDTPRSRCGTFGGRTAASYDTNGQGWYAAQMFEGGGNNYGFRVGYVQRTGIDYFDGGGNRIAARHNVRNWDMSFGYDLSPCASLEFTYLRNDLTGVDMPSQITDLDFLTSDALSIRYVAENGYYYDQMVISSWYNESAFNGLPSNQSKDPRLARGDNFSPFTPYGVVFNTSGRNQSTGCRTQVSWGQADSGQVTVGADITYVKQSYLERDNFDFASAPAGFYCYGLSPAEQADAGMFADMVLPLSYRLSIKGGGRIDWMSSSSLGRRLDRATGTPIQQGQEFQSFVLGSGYLNAEYRINRELTGVVGFGVAQRAPTPTDLYADLPYLSILQTGGLFFPDGNTGLVKETAHQIDVGLKADYADFQGGMRGFYSWVNDFITYDNTFIHSISSVGADTVNQDSVLAGGELYGDLKLNNRLTPFGSLAYVVGRNMILDQPLWGVPPLQGIVGLRLTDSYGGSRWGVEYRARIVAPQNRLGLFVTNGQNPGAAAEIRTPGFVTHDVRAYYRVNEMITLIAGIENFGDAQYLEHLDSRLNLNDLSLGGVFRRGSNGYFLVQMEY